MITREEFIRETVPGKRVVHRISGYTGEVRTVFPEWGVEVWVPDRGYERERWSWSMITKRFPRTIKRFPRPFRFPRLMPTLICHCRIGRMEVKGENRVRCLRCGFLIDAAESFPDRFERASKLLKRYLDEKLVRLRSSKKRKGEGRKTDQARKRPVSQNRPKRKASGRSQKPKPKRQKNKGGLVVRPTRRKEVKKHHGKKRTKAIPQNNTVPASGEHPGSGRDDQTLPTPQEQVQEVVQPEPLKEG